MSRRRPDPKPRKAERMRVSDIERQVREGYKQSMAKRGIHVDARFVARFHKPKGTP